ncbi:glycosyltransferase family 39 protein [Thioclava sp. BHET1]|nr:glycosyltransferase family 39 protein [Thioclava sp. BHET1]
MTRFFARSANAAPTPAWPATDKRLWQLVLIAIACFVTAQIAGLLLRPLLPIDETRYLAAAWEMHLNHNWFVPTKNFELYTDKPPLLFWLINVAWAIGGVSDFLGRLVGPAIALLVVALTGKLATRLWPDDTGAAPRAMLALIAMPFFEINGALTMFDMLLTSCTLGGLIALTHTGEGKRAGWLWFGVALGLGVMAKGPVILLHLMPAALAVGLWHPSRPGLRETIRGVGLGLAVALGLLALWLIPAAIIGGPAYRHEIFWTQSAGRIASSFAHARPFWWYLPLLPVLMFPWLLVPQFWTRLRGALGDPALRLLAVWGATAFVIFSLISGKQPHYLVPELPAMALLAQRLLRNSPISLGIAAIIPGILALVALVAGAGLISPAEGADLLTPRAVPLAAALALAALIWWALLRSGIVGALILGLGMITILNVAIGLSHAHRGFSAHAISETIEPFEGKGIAFAGHSYNAEFNFAGRMTQPVSEIDVAALPAWAKAHPDGVVIARSDRFDPGWAAHWQVPYRGKTYEIWRISDRPATPQAPSAQPVTAVPAPAPAQ